MKWEQRHEVAKEAARLLYYGLATEYIFAKKRAARSLRGPLPSNKEVALELDNLAESLEGDERKKRLVSMRMEALTYMEFLKEFQPVLKGSVWRGTIITKRSDIDIVIYADTTSEPLAVLNKHQIHPEIKYNSRQIGSISKTYIHLLFTSPSGTNVEIVVRPTEDQGLREICEVFGDIITGFTLSKLVRVLKEDPTMKVLPD